MSSKEYRKVWMKNKRLEGADARRSERLESLGRCIKCEMILAQDPGHNCEVWLERPKDDWWG